MAVTLVQAIESLESSLTGCPDPTQGSAAIIPAIGGATVCRTLQNADGSPFDLTAYDQSTTTPAGEASTTPPPAYEHHVLIANAVCAAQGATEVPMTISGDKVCFEAPAALTSSPGIYEVEWRLRGGSGAVEVFDRSLLSVEPTLEQRSAYQMPMGPITIGRIRMRLRDFPGLNEYWGEFEFSDVEIINAILEPVQAYNEMLPFSNTYSPEVFPFRQQWLDAIVARLLIMGGTWYMREERDIKFADGKVDSNRGKGVNYIKLGENMWQQFKLFCHQQKVAIMWSGGEYSFRGNMQS